MDDNLPCGQFVFKVERRFCCEALGDLSPKPFWHTLISLFRFSDPLTYCLE